MIEADNKIHIQSINDVRTGEVSRQTEKLEQAIRFSRMLCAGFVKLSQQIVYYKETTTIHQLLLPRSEE